MPGSESDDRGERYEFILLCVAASAKHLEHLHDAVRAPGTASRASRTPQALFEPTAHCDHELCGNNVVRSKMSDGLQRSTSFLLEGHSRGRCARAGFQTASRTSDEPHSKDISLPTQNRIET